MGAHLDAEDTAALGSRVTRKVTYRIFPIVGLLYVFNYMDRSNISYAQLGMEQELGITTANTAFAGTPTSPVSTIPMLRLLMNPKRLSGHPLRRPRMGRQQIRQRMAPPQYLPEDQDSSFPISLIANLDDPGKLTGKCLMSTMQA